MSRRSLVVIPVLMLVAVPLACTAHRKGTLPSGSAQPVSLESSGHGFLIPKGWTNTLPLTNYGGPASFAEYRAPSSSSVISYETNGGSFASAYKGGHAPNPLGLLPSHDDPHFACSLTAHRLISVNRASYECKDPVAGYITEGVILVLPYPKGFELLQVTVQRQERALAGFILASLKG